MISADKRVTESSFSFWTPEGCPSFCLFGFCLFSLQFYWNVIDSGKRNPSKTVGVARGHQRADTLKP